MEDTAAPASSDEAETGQIEANPKPDLISMIKDLPDAPNQAVIDGWKAKYGDVYVSGFSETEIYIWRAINRAEYKQMQIQQQMLAAQADAEQKLDSKVTMAIEGQFDQEDQMVAKCLLWPKLSVEELQKKAGTIPSLLEQLTQQSNFLSPQQASVLVMRL